VKSGAWAATALALLIPWTVFGQANEPAHDLEAWRDTLRYGIETEVLSTIKKIADSGEKGLNGELLQLIRPESSPALLQEVLDLFGKRGLREAEPEVREMVASDALLDPGRLVPMIRYLAAIRSKASEQLLLPLLDSSNDEVALAAIRALGVLGGPESGKRLLDLLADSQYPEGRKSQLILALGQLKFAPALDALVLITGNPEENKIWRMYAATALGDIADSRAVPPLRALFADPDSLVRAYAASALAKFDMSEVEGTLREGLRDSNVKVRLAAAKALANPAAGRSVDILIYKARMDPERQVRSQAIESLGEIGGAKAFSFLRELYRDAAAAIQYREAALSALCARDLPGSLPTIRAVIDQEWSRKDLQVLSFTARRLSATTAQGLEGILERFLSHPNEVIRLYGLRGVRLNKIHGLRQKVSSMAAADPHPAVRREAAIALQEL
jgi:HEAT repeat protein